MRPPPTAPARVAIVGTGMSGEVAAYALHNYSSHVVAAVYEAAERPGLHVNSLEHDGVMVDVPLRAASPHYYPNLMQLYQHLGVPLQAVDYSSCGSHYRPNQSYFRYHNILLFGFAIPFVWVDTMATLSRLLACLRIVLDLLWFVFTGPYYLCHQYEELRGMTLGSFLKQHSYSFYFVHMFLYPVMSTLLSCSYAQVDNYPAHFIIEFFCARKTTIFTGWRRVTNAGISEVSAKLLHGVPRSVFRFGNKVRAVEPADDAAAGGGVWVVDCTGKREHYDVVIIATEPNVAAAILRDKTRDEAELLNCMATYSANITVHRDASLMPSTRANWCGLNFFSLSTGSAAALHDLPERFTASMTTAHLRAFNGALKEDLFETWNSYRQPPRELIVQDTTMTRSVWTVTAARTFATLLCNAQGRRGVYFVGSYCSPGVTLLEQAATSSLNVAAQLGARLPFDVKPTYESCWPILVLSHMLVLGRDAVTAFLSVFMTIGVVKFVVQRLASMGHVMAR